MDRERLFLFALWSPPLDADVVGSESMFCSASRIGEVEPGTGGGLKYCENYPSHFIGTAFSLCVWLPKNYSLLPHL